jgi:predicted GNAT family acetyltransferase
MSVLVLDRPERNRYEIHVDGELAGYSEYLARPGLIAFTHTEIHEQHKHRGLGEQLIAETSTTFASAASRSCRSARSCADSSKTTASTRLSSQKPSGSTSSCEANVAAVDGAAPSNHAPSIMLARPTGRPERHRGAP